MFKLAQAVHSKLSAGIAQENRDNQVEGWELVPMPVISGFYIRLPAHDDGYLAWGASYCVCIFGLAFTRNAYRRWRVFKSADRAALYMQEV